MNREELRDFILETYCAKHDFPWIQHPEHEVFRHPNNRKWFALIMDVPKNKLGLQGTDKMDVVNFKGDADLIWALKGEAGFFPAYHMSKTNWITVALDGTVPAERIKKLLAMSYEATAVQKSKFIKTAGERNFRF